MAPFNLIESLRIGKEFYGLIRQVLEQHALVSDMTAIVNITIHICVLVCT
jgi:hypothetical protein